MQRFSPEIPWVLIDVRETPTLARNHLYFYGCDVCGAQGGGDQREAHAFATAHRVHAAPQGSFRLGDAFAAVAKPVARAFGLADNCSPCEARRRAMNSVRFR